MLLPYHFVYCYIVILQHEPTDGIPGPDRLYDSHKKWETGSRGTLSATLYHQRVKKVVNRVNCRLKHFIRSQRFCYNSPFFGYIFQLFVLELCIIKNE